MRESEETLFELVEYLILNRIDCNVSVTVDPVNLWGFECVDLIPNEFKVEIL